MLDQYFNINYAYAYCRGCQELEVYAPSDPAVLKDAIETIKVPDPYIDDEPCQIEFRAEVIKADTSLYAGILKAHRVLTFTFEFNDVETFASWVADEHLSDAKDKASPDEILHSVYPESLCTRPVCDYKVSFIDDKMTNFSSLYSVEYAGQG